MEGMLISSLIFILGVLQCEAYSCCHPDYAALTAGWQQALKPICENLNDRNFKSVLECFNKHGTQVQNAWSRCQQEFKSPAMSSMGFFNVLCNKKAEEISNYGCCVLEQLVNQNGDVPTTILSSAKYTVCFKDIIKGIC